jgi:hypothetical protein
MPLKKRPRCNQGPVIYAADKSRWFLFHRCPDFKFTIQSKKYFIRDELIEDWNTDKFTNTSQLNQEVEDEKNIGNVKP